MQDKFLEVKDQPLNIGSKFGWTHDINCTLPNSIVLYYSAGHRVYFPKQLQYEAIF